jgi:phage terminase large subunit GpA-like protein
MTDQTPADERTVADAIAEATDEWSENRGVNFDPEDYTWGFVPCPHCDETTLMGVLDPDEQLEASENTFAVIPLHEESENQ